MVEGQTVVLRKRDEFDEERATKVGDRVYEPWRVEIFPEDLPRLIVRVPLYNTREVRITDGPRLTGSPGRSRKTKTTTGTAVRPPGITYAKTS